MNLAWSRSRRPRGNTRCSPDRIDSYLPSLTITVRRDMRERDSSPGLRVLGRVHLGSVCGPVDGLVAPKAVSAPSGVESCAQVTKATLPGCFGLSFLQMDERRIQPLERRVRRLTRSVGSAHRNTSRALAGRRRRDDLAV